MKAQPLWRVQNENGEGPYHSQVDAIDEALHEHNRCPLHPRTSPPGEYWDWDQYRYGFDSEIQARTWFTPEQLALLAEYGYRLTPVWGKVVVEDGFQVIYIPSEN